MSKLEAAFHDDLIGTYHDAAKLGYRATSFLHMVHENGGVETAHRLLATDKLSEGLGRIWEIGRLDISLEATVLKPEYASLFGDDERCIARERLAEMGYTAPWDRV